MFGALIGTLITLLVIGAIVGGVAFVIWLVKNPKSTLQAAKQLAGHAGFRLGFIALLCLAVMIPVGLVSDIVRERAERYRSVLSEIAGIWGKEQHILGPALVIPYAYETKRRETYTRPDGASAEREITGVETTYAAFLPETLAMEGTLDHHYRHRGIYQSLVYTADVKLGGVFAAPDFSGVEPKPSVIRWQDAYVALGIADTRAITDDAALSWDGSAVSFAPGARYAALMEGGIHAPVKLDGVAGEHRFSVRLRINGSQGFWFAPVGKHTDVTLSSKWPSPSFKGSVLPDRHTVDAKGFEASWSVPHLARTYPQAWSEREENGVLPAMKNFSLGVQLFEPAHLYATVERAVKYALLFVGLTFFAYFLFERTSGIRLHFVQYILIGGALAMFYLMILSFAEHIGFEKAYLGASAIVVALTTLYTAAALRQWKKGCAIAAVLTGLYGVLYSILHLEDYALLVGTLLLLATLVIAMLATRNMHREG